MRSVSLRKSYLQRGLQLAFSYLIVCNLFIVKKPSWNVTATFQSFKMLRKSLESFESWDGYTCSISSLTALRRCHIDLKLERNSGKINWLTREHKNDMKKLNYKKYLHCISMDSVFPPTRVLSSVFLLPIISSTGIFTDKTESHQACLCEVVFNSSAWGSIRSKHICRAIASTFWERNVYFHVNVKFITCTFARLAAISLPTG